MTLSDSDIERTARALEGVVNRAYTTPIVYPWAIQQFVPRPGAERPPPAPGRRRIYVHVPFCNYHCSFCFYAVRTGARREEMERYVAAVRRELDWVPAGGAVSRLVVGGGTPTALPTELLSALLSSIFERMPSAADGAHTLEASPDSLTEAHLRVLLDHGIGRVSIGVESMNGGVLDAVHRRHTPAQAIAACQMVTGSGLSLNVDLIYGLPGQTEDSFRRDVAAIAATGADSLCLYGLRLNERTPVAGQLAPEERLDLARVMRWRAFVKQAAEEAGFVQTRCYTFKRDTLERSWHERSAATQNDAPPAEIGLGMSARSQIGTSVYRNIDRNDVYMQRVEQGLSPVESVFDLEATDLKTQYLAGTLANGRPLERAGYLRRFGVPVDEDYGQSLARLCDAGLITDHGERLTLTETGMLVYDRVLLSFYPERARGWLASRPATLRREARSTPGAPSA